MSLTATNLPRRSLVEYVSALAIAVIAAITIAVVALQGARGWQGRPSLMSEASTPPAYYETSPPVHVIYIVDTQQKAESIARSEQEMLVTYLDSYQQPSNRTFAVLVATTAEAGVQAHQLANLTAQEMRFSGTIFQLVDLRED